LDSAFELLRKADDHAGILVPRPHILLPPFENLYNMANEHINDVSRPDAACSSKHCPCHIALTKEVKELKKKVADILRR
jgi:hypothetical protein